MGLAKISLRIRSQGTGNPFDSESYQFTMSGVKESIERKVLVKSATSTTLTLPTSNRGVYIRNLSAVGTAASGVRVMLSGVKLNSGQRLLENQAIFMLPTSTRGIRLACSTTDETYVQYIAFTGL